MLLRFVPLCLQRTVERQGEATCRASLVGRDAHAIAVVQPVGFLTSNDDLDQGSTKMRPSNITMPPCLTGETWTHRRFELPRLRIFHTIPAGDHSHTSRVFFKLFFQSSLRLSLKKLVAAQPESCCFLLMNGKMFQQKKQTHAIPPDIVGIHGVGKGHGRLRSLRPRNTSENAPNERLSDTKVIADCVPHEYESFLLHSHPRSRS